MNRRPSLTPTMSRVEQEMLDMITEDARKLALEKYNALRKTVVPPAKALANGFLQGLSATIADEAEAIVSAMSGKETLGQALTRTHNRYKAHEDKHPLSYGIGQGAGVSALIGTTRGRLGYKNPAFQQMTRYGKKYYDRLPPQTKRLLKKYDNDILRSVLASDKSAQGIAANYIANKIMKSVMQRWKTPPASANNGKRTGRAIGVGVFGAAGSGLVADKINEALTPANHSSPQSTQSAQSRQSEQNQRPKQGQITESAFKDYMP